MKVALSLLAILSVAHSVSAGAFIACADGGNLV